ncbi:MAG: TlpA disulfide reductase family protein [Saprospiraceae bacterium]
MKNLLFSFLACFFFYTSSGQSTPIKVYNSFDEMEAAILKYDNDTTYLINFWATWCAPCVKELPYFEKAATAYAGKKFKMILVSLDFAEQLDKKVIPFVKDRKIQSEVVLLDDQQANKWIDRVSPEWSGAIPITLVYKGEKRAFYEKEFHSVKELEEIINPFFNN